MPAHLRVTDPSDGVHRASVRAGEATGCAKSVYSCGLLSGVCAAAFSRAMVWGIPELVIQELGDRSFVIEGDNQMRIIYYGSGKFGLPTLRSLHQHHQVLIVVTQPDRPAGRRRQLTSTPVAAWAQQHGIETLKTENASDSAVVEQIAELAPDGAIVIAFGQKLSEPLIDASGPLVVNLHASLLPKYRGAAPINWAILNCEPQTGLSVISLAQRMDAGSVYGQSTTPISPTETAGELHDRLAALGPDLILDVLKRFQTGRLDAQPQDDTSATRAPKLSKSDGWVDFNTNADEVRGRIHGLTPWPGAKVHWHRLDQPDVPPQALTLRRVAVDQGHPTGLPPGTVAEGYRVATTNGAVKLLELQAPGGRPMDIQAFIRGRPLQPGDTLARIDP